VELAELAVQIPDFDHKKHAEKIKIFAWYLHTYKEQEQFNGAKIKNCYSELNLEPPSAITPFITAMVNRRPKQALQKGGGYCLEKRVRDSLDEQYGQRAATVHVHKLLTELPDKIPDLEERDYLNEALKCFKYKAFRASIVMAWNLAYDHLCQLILKRHLTVFNAQLAKSFPKESLIVSKRDDLTELKESQVLQVCKSANIISGSVHKVMKEKLDRRNVAAHPSGVGIFETTAEEFIKDLIENVVVKLQ
jgi:hypothetical protein